MEKSKKGKLGKILGNLDVALACVVLSAQFIVMLMR